MSLPALTLVYRGTADSYSLEVSFDDDRVVREKFTPGSSTPLTSIATQDECLRNATLGPLLNAGTFELVYTPGTLEASDTTGGVKDSVRVATTGALAANTRTNNTLIADAVGALGNIDGVAVAVGDRILVKNEGTGANRGIYRVTVLGDGSTRWQMERTSDFNDSLELMGGCLVPVLTGTVNGKQAWMLTTTGTITVNSTSLTFERVLGMTVASDSTFLIQDEADPTKQGGFDVGTNVGAGQTRTIAFANENVDLTPDSGTYPRATTAPKPPVRVATTVPLPAYTRATNVITANANGALPSIDGVSLSVSDRVLLKNGAADADNGIYTVTDLGSGGTPFILTRATDFNTSAKAGRGVLIPVIEGAVNRAKTFQHTTAAAVTLNTTALVFEDPTQTRAMKLPVRLATVVALAAYTRTGNVITANANGAMANVDGVAPAVGDRILLKNGAANADNGIYVVRDLGSGGTPFILDRAADMDVGTDIFPGLLVLVQAGTENGLKVFTLIATSPITINTTALVFDLLPTLNPQPVRMATHTTLAAYTRTANVIQANGNGVMADVDGVTPVVGDRILLKNGAAGADNGIYRVRDIGTAGTPFILDRAIDFDTLLDTQGGGLIPVLQGTVNAGLWQHTTTGTVVINTTALTFVKVGGQKGLLYRTTLAANSNITGNGADTTETNYVHTALVLPLGIINTARRQIRFRGIVEVVGQNAADTIRIRVRMTDGTGALLWDSGAINAPADTVFSFSGMYQLQAVGAAGELMGEALGYNPIGSALVRTGDDNAAVDTTAARNLVVTTVPGSNNAGNIYNLRHFECEVWSE